MNEGCKCLAPLKKSVKIKKNVFGGHLAINNNHSLEPLRKHNTEKKIG